MLRSILMSSPALGLPPAHGGQARLQLRFERRGERTVLAQREHLGPLRIQKALYPGASRSATASCCIRPAGIAGGDELSIEVRLDAAAHAPADHARRRQVVSQRGRRGCCARPW